MCMALYLATDEPVPMSEWSRASALFVDELNSEQYRVKRQFAKPTVRYIGVLGKWMCSCAFPSVLETSTDAEGCQLIEELRSLFLSGTANGREVELFYCWMDDEGDEPERRVETTPESLGSESCPLETGTFYRVRGAAQQGVAADEP